LPKAKAHDPNEATSHQIETLTRQNLKWARHPWYQISTLRINPAVHIDMPLAEPNSQSTRHYFSQTQKSCFIYTTTLDHNLQPISRKTSNICPEEAKVPLDENPSGNRHFLEEISLPLPTISSQNKSVDYPLFHVKNWVASEFRKTTRF
jgi:hypothetical protein